MTLDSWAMAFDSLPRAFLLGVQQAAPLMPAGGRILAITSAAGRRGGLSPGLAAESAVTALQSAVRHFAVALAPRGITVNAITPGPAADAGRIVALLCSDDAAWITGQVIVADGGASLLDTVSPADTQPARVVAAV